MSTGTVLGIGSRVIHPAHGAGVIIRIHAAAYDVCFVHHGIRSIGRNYDGWEIVEVIDPEEEISFNDLEKSLMRVLNHYSDISQVVKLGDKWKNGSMILKPEDDDLQSKEIPIETFFHKIVLLRDRLRVMEQRINAHKILTDEDKINLQQYITRIYGSLTTFNVLFSQKEHQFVGEKK